MSNHINNFISLGPRSLAWGLKTILGLPAKTRKIPNVLGERHILVLGNEWSWLNRPLGQLQCKSISPPALAPAPDSERAVVRPSGTVRDILSGMSELLEQDTGCRVQAIYYFKFKGGEAETAVYEDAINTSRARGAIFGTRYQGKELVGIDREFIKGELTEAIVVSRLDPRNFRRFGVDPFVRNMSLLFGVEYFIILPVHDGDKIVGKVNIGVSHFKGPGLSEEKMQVLQASANRLSTAVEDRRGIPLSPERIKTFNRNVEESSLLKLILWSVVGGPTRNMQELIGILDDTIERSLAAFSEVIGVLVDAVETREAYTGRHSVGVARYAEIVVDELLTMLKNRQMTLQQQHDAVVENNARKILMQQEIDGLKRDIKTIENNRGLIYEIFLLHDVGKLGVPDNILNKPGALTEGERKQIESHPLLGASLLERMPEDNPSRQEAMNVCRHHHEAFDGLGYPARLARYDIPVLARLAAAVDTLHAITTSRPYREFSPNAHLRAFAELVRGTATEFDPDVVKSVLRNAREGTLPVVDYLFEKLKSSELTMRRFLAAAERDDEGAIRELAAGRGLREARLAALCNEFLSAENHDGGARKETIKARARRAAERIDRYTKGISMRDSRVLNIREELDQGAEGNGLFGDLLREAVEFAERMNEEIKICGGILSCLTKEMTSQNLFQAIMNYQDRQASQQDGYTRLQRRASNLLIDHLLEVWIIRKGILEEAAVEQARVEIREAWECDQRRKSEAVERAEAEYQKIETAKNTVEGLAGKLPAGEYEQLSQWMEARAAEKMRERDETSRSKVRARTLSDKLMALLVADISARPALERAAMIKLLAEPLIDENLMFDVHGQLIARINGDESLDAGARAKLLAALDNLMSRMGRV